MTINSYLFNTEERLNMNNFENWYPTVKFQSPSIHFSKALLKKSKRKIHNAKTAYDIMTKIKEHYDKYKSKDVDHYI
ncbi:hypothetical protein H8356DRAFT_1338081 [Neocallimastix lanati (nom. inval.)]|nr:hypothetical protein H8356DRAFT_1338081 [Neocallimastix sp. JGI-2020a]